MQFEQLAGWPINKLAIFGATFLYSFKFLQSNVIAMRGRTLISYFATILAYSPSREHLWQKLFTRRKKRREKKRRGKKDRRNFDFDPSMRSWIFFKARRVQTRVKIATHDDFESVFFLRLQPSCIHPSSSSSLSSSPAHVRRDSTHCAAPPAGDLQV